MLKAKFTCNSVAVDAGSPNVETVHLRPVHADSGVNKEWSKYTPSGELKMVITNPEAQGKIKPGQEYILDIREAQEGE